MSISFLIATGSSVPIYRQIVEQICRAVGSGELAIGDQLPSVRGLAEQLVVNHNTVAKAYAELARDGLIETQQGRGVFVTRRRNVYSRAERTRRIDEALATFISEAMMLDYSPDEIRQAIDRKLRELDGGAK